MDDPGTDALRKLAPNWALAGDEQLLSILQNTHHRLLSKCQEANCQLEQMATALNDASISLQNVNNQFMALSSSQFIESRVYDDDDLSTDVPAVKEQPKPEVPDELTSLKRSISVLENAHEIITILQDSDSESDTEDEMPARMVLKPKDMYAARPLPYIIGSQPWKNKWHAGLLLEDSDSDSTASKVEHDSDQYSQSEPEDTHTDKLAVPHTHTTISETSSEPPSEQGSVPKPTPSDVASEIARRLGAREPVKMVEREPEDEETPKPTVRKIYRPQDPVSSIIFPDEPPPLSDQSDGQDSDIFADLHKAQPYARTHGADDLFANERDSDEGDIFSDFATKPTTNPSANPTSLFDSGPAPNMFVKHTDNHHKSDDQRRNIHDDNHRRNVYDNDDRSKNNDDRSKKNDDRTNVYRQESKADDVRARGDEEADRGVKKPIGGISLFGNKGTESIGAAILKRNQRKSSTSGEDSESDFRSESQSNQQIRKEKDIFDDLFARSERNTVTKDKDLKTEIQKKVVEKVKEKKVEKPKVDLFSDNLFDDIDDIFSTNVVKMPAKDDSKSKSIFEDDDDLFSEIAAPKPMKIEVASSSNKNKSLFDSDDELFSENKSADKPVDTPKPVEINKPKVAERTKINKGSNKSKEITKSLFDDDEDELFSDLKTKEITKVQNSSADIEKPLDFGREGTKNTAPIKNLTNTFKSPSLFDDDDEDDESNLFVDPAKSSNIQIDIAAPIKKAERVRVPEEIVENLSSKSEIKIPDKTDEVPSSSVKTHETEQVENEKVDVNKDSNIAIVDKIVNASETEKRLKEENSSVLPVSENVGSDIKNVESNAAKIFDHIHKNMQNIEQSSSDTNNDFSDQDFDDLPPEKATNVIKNSNIVTETDEIPTEKHNIFDKTTLEEDIDELFVTSQQNTDNTETRFKNTQPDFTETITYKTEQDNKTVETATKIIEPDIFSNILTEPPVFEKPKEPKRSKNVNALFDDDSDDESLFFKKNDPIFVENPEDFTPTQDRIFGLFTDEPPDDGFSKISDEFDDDLFSTKPKPVIPQNDDLPPIPDTIQFEDNISTKNAIPDIENVDPVADIFSDLPKDEIKPAEEMKKESRSDIEENLFKIPATDNVDERQKPSPNEEQLFEVPAKDLKFTLKDKPDLFSDDENLFTSGPKFEKPASLTATKEDKPVPGYKNLSFTDKPTTDLSSDDENLFASLPTLEKPTSYDKEITKPEIKNQESENKSSDDELFTSLQSEKPLITENKLLQQDSKSDEDLFRKPETISKPTETLSESKSEKSDQKKVGKLKVGLNINVNALLPGASPKKIKPNDQLDGQSQSLVDSQKPTTHSEVQKSGPDKAESQNPDSKLVKAVSFDGKPESDVLDNKLSKERAKIQVKRRPSTRRARKEAVRKSGIDFGEDSTDNSSSIDDPPRKHTNVEKPNNDETKPNEIKQTIQHEYVDNSHVQAKIDDTTVHAEIDPITAEKQPTMEPVVIERQAQMPEKPSFPRDVKSKVVYILNDEDIFNTSPVEKPENLNRNLDSNAGVTTLGKVYNKNLENTSKKDTKSSLFGDEKDDEIFKAKTTVKKSTIFDSDSEEELFGTSKKEEKEIKVEKIEVKKEIRREVVKGSLFGDEDDDDDLFGVKTKKIVDQKPQASKSTVKETPKPAEPVFEDPLSMFGDDD